MGLKFNYFAPKGRSMFALGGAKKMETTKRMTIEQWESKYKPIVNPNAEDECSADRFETHGEDLEFVLNVANRTPKKVWTLEDIGGQLIICAGYHLVNRMNYFITEVEWEDENLEVQYCDEDVCCDEDADIDESTIQKALKGMLDHLMILNDDEKLSSDTLITMAVDALFEDEKYGSFVDKNNAQSYLQQIADALSKKGLTFYDINILDTEICSECGVVLLPDDECYQDQETGLALCDFCSVHCADCGNVIASSKVVGNAEYYCEACSLKAIVDDNVLYVVKYEDVGEFNVFATFEALKKACIELAIENDFEIVDGENNWGQVFHYAEKTEEGFLIDSWKNNLEHSIVFDACKEIYKVFDAQIETLEFKEASSAKAVISFGSELELKLVEFTTEAELNAYLQGVTDMDGWDKWFAVESNSFQTSSDNTEMLNLDSKEAKCFNANDYTTRQLIEMEFEDLPDSEHKDNMIDEALQLVEECGYTVGEVANEVLAKNTSFVGLPELFSIRETFLTYVGEWANCKECRTGENRANGSVTYLMDGLYLYEFKTREDAFKYLYDDDRSVPYAMAEYDEELTEANGECSFGEWEFHNGFQAEWLKQKIIPRFCIVQNTDEEGSSTLEDYDTLEKAMEAYNYIKENGCHKSDEHYGEIVQLESGTEISMDIEWWNLENNFVVKNERIDVPVITIQ